MKQLLEDYQRRLKVLELEIDKLTPSLNSMKMMTIYEISTVERLKTKASCYSTFISELERAIKAEEKVNY